MADYGSQPKSNKEVGKSEGRITTDITIADIKECLPERQRTRVVEDETDTTTSEEDQPIQRNIYTCWLMIGLVQGSLA